MGSGMQDVCLFSLSLFGSGSYHMLQATGFEDNGSPVWCMCATPRWHTDVCGHPPPDSPLMACRGPLAKTSSLPQQIRWLWTRAGWKTCHLKTYMTNTNFMAPAGRLLSARAAVKYSRLSKSDVCTAPDKITASAKGRIPDPPSPSLPPESFLNILSKLWNIDRYLLLKYVCNSSVPPQNKIRKKEGLGQQTR